MMPSLHLSQFRTTGLLLVLFLTLSSCSQESVIVPTEDTTTVTEDPSSEDLSPLCMAYDGSTFHSSELEGMRFYNYSELISEEGWYSYPALDLSFRYEGTDSIYEREKLFEDDPTSSPSLLFSEQDQVECVAETIDNWSTEIQLQTNEELVDLKKNLLSDGALPEEQLIYGGQAYGHMRGFNLGNGIADFYFKVHGDKTYVFVFTWLHEGEEGASLDEIIRARSNDPLPSEYQMILETFNPPQFVV